MKTRKVLRGFAHMVSAPRPFLIRTLVLIAVVHVGSSVVANAFFGAESDMFVHFWIVIVTSVFAGGLGWYWVIQPLARLAVTTAENRHLDFERRFNEVIDHMQDGIVVDDERGVVQHNRAALKNLDCTELQLRGLEAPSPGWKLTSENGADLDRDDYPSAQCFRSGIPISGVVGLHKPNGTLAWLRVHSSPVFAARTEEDRRAGTPPKVISVISTYRDITSEREALQRFELAMKAVKLGVWDMDVMNGRIMWDENMCEIYGEKRNVLKRAYSDFENYVIPEDRERVRRSFEFAFLECNDVSLEFRIRRADGEIRVIRTESRGFYSREGKALRHVGVNWDITEQRAQEVRVLQASKMSSLGEMSAGIAHEINNPLAIIIGKAEAIRSSIEAPNPNRELLFRHVDVIERTVNRIAKIVKSLRAFSRDGQNDPFEQVNVGEIVNEALVLCHSKFLNNGIELTVVEMSEEVVIDARSVEISQVLLNLLNNAYDAVSSLEEKWVSVEIRNGTGSIDLIVTDSGAGIPSEVRERMTQPFFTTKEVGSGTGLGLSIVTGIVASHSGKLNVDTTCRNTRIVVTLPKNQTPGGSTSAA